jgi:hypothetical protein
LEISRGKRSEVTTPALSDAPPRQKAETSADPESAASNTSASAGSEGTPNLDSPCAGTPVSMIESIGRQKEAVEHYNKGAELTNSGHHAEGAKEFDLAIVADPLMALAYYYKGIVLLGESPVAQGGKIQASRRTIDCFQMYLALAPDGSQAKTAQNILESLGASPSSSAATQRVAAVRSSSDSAASRDSSSKTGKCSSPMPHLRNDCVVTSNESDPRDGMPVFKITNVCSEELRVKVCDGPDGNYDNHGCYAETIQPSKSSRYRSRDSLRSRGTFNYWAGSYEERSGVDNIDPATGGPGLTTCSAK